MGFFIKRDNSKSRNFSDASIWNHYKNGKLTQKSIHTKDGCFFDMTYYPEQGFFASSVSIPHQPSQHFYEYICGAFIDYPYLQLNQMRNELVTHWQDDIERWQQERTISQTAYILQTPAPNPQKQIPPQHQYHALPTNTPNHSWEIVIKDPLAKEEAPASYLERAKRTFG